VRRRRRFQLLSRARGKVSRDRYELVMSSSLGVDFDGVDVLEHPSGGIYLLQVAFSFSGSLK
jgi:hypothetical protein